MSDASVNKNSESGFVAVLLGVATAGPIYVWLALLVFLPMVLMLAYGFFGIDARIIRYEFTLENFQRIFTTYGVWYLMVRTIVIALLAAIVASVIAYPMALYTSRLSKGKTAAVMLVIIPLWISLLMRIFAWRIILGETGVLNTLLMDLGLISEPIKALLYSPFAVFLTFIYVALPFAFVSVFAVIDRIPANLIRAARDAGASEFRVFWTVIWPMSRPGLRIGLALGFLIAIGDYVTPAIVGGIGGTMIGTVIAAQFGIAGNWPYGAALAVVLLVTVTVIVGIIFFLMRIRGGAYGDGPSDPHRPVPAKNLKEKAGRVMGFVFYTLPYGFLYAPLVLMAVFSFNNSEVQALPMSGFTLRWYQEMFTNAPMMAALKQSLIVGLSVLLISIVFGTVFAVLLTFGRLKFAGLLEKTLLLPLALPGVILGIALVLAFQLLHVPHGYPRLVLGHSTFVMPVVLSVVIDRLRRLDPSIIEASMDLGAPPLTTFLQVLLPLLGSAIFGGALLGFTLSVDEVVLSTFLVGPDPTLPVWVWNQMRFGFTPSVNAIFVCLGVLTFGLVIVSQSMLQRK